MRTIIFMLLPYKMRLKKVVEIAEQVVKPRYI